MNAGRIEQVDAPHLLYTRPRTRFVAGFIGRTNLIEARLHDGEIGFYGVVLQAGQLGEAPAEGSLAVLLSVRPQSVGLHGTPPVAKVRPLVAGNVTQRVFLGETWDYLVSAQDSGLRLRATAPPLQILEVGEAVWIELNPRQMVVVD